jgi:hypothetical protein
MIITAASAVYGTRLLAWLGGLSANWPSHPKVLVYDLGLSSDTRAELVRNGVEFKSVPAFCPHWRLHFTWKPWCWHDAPADHVLWLDAGTFVLDSLDEVFEAVERLGYFATPNYQWLSKEASEAACRGCGVPHSFTQGRPTIAANVFGFDKAEKMRGLISEALGVAMVEDYIKATEPRHRHDQAIVSLLLHKQFDPVFLFDHRIYGSMLSPREVPGQKIWAHRRRIRPEDLDQLRSRIGKKGPRFVPQEPSRHERIIRGTRQLVSSVLRPWRRQSIYHGVRG